ncbi:MAG: tetratricopeptide repeat protein [Alphaproteobacteria bacterium]|jgi:tetratricopeptide (TPR) repeat protein|nr:tetratricopeptide repeat protein [Alphaproteobacteria bacterium]MBT4711926.1 tetratricopeptide repeat protein [Alphaproteobacteria bacterium]MBT5859859.1 tetratricopeptide repeat protein [Alphaproteobacteria bacterium]
MLMRFAFVAAIFVGLISAPVMAQAPADGLAAYQALANRDWDLAVFYATRAIEAGTLPPGDLAAVLAYRADALRKKGDFAAAVEDYDAGLDIGYPTAFRVRVLNNRGIAFYAIGIFDLAIEDYTEALALDPTFSAALDNRGTAWVAMGLYEQGIIDYTAVIALDPGNTVAYSNRGRTFLEMRFWQQAVDDFTTALNLGAATALPVFNRAMAFEGLGETEMARADLVIAFTMEPNEVTYQEKYREYGLIP